MANILSLQSKIEIPKTGVSLSTLSNLVASHLLDQPCADKNEQQQRQDALEILPKLESGLDINVRFKDTSVEFRQELAVFDVFGMEVLQ